MNIEKLIEKVLNEWNNPFDISTSEHLLYLVHDKDHVLDKKSKIGFMNTVFASCKNNRSKVKLYRGLYKEKIEDFVPGQTYTFARYQSFSEDLNIAKKFTKNKLILLLTSHTGGFPYSHWMKDFYENMKKKDPQEYNSVDGDFMIETANEEKEWIFNIDTVINIVDVAERSGYTYITAEL